MKRTDYFYMLTDLFAFKTMKDGKGNELVVYQSHIEHEGIAESIEDKTEYEALVNHVHLLDRVKPYEFDALKESGAKLGKALLECLKFNYPDKYFYVFVNIQVGDSFIIRFYQKWEGEPPYFDLDNLTDDEKEIVIMFHG